MKAQVVSVFLCLSMFGMTSCPLDGLQDQKIEARFQQVTQEIEQLKQTVAGLQAQLNAKGNQSGPVAFTASLERTIDVLGSHQHIIFDYVITNIGNGYSPTDGHFTAPVTGAYAFFVTLRNILHYSASAQLLRNGHRIGHILAHGNSIDNHVTSTIAITVQLQKGDQVWVQNEYSFSTVDMAAACLFSPAILFNKTKIHQTSFHIVN